MDSTTQPQLGLNPDWDSTPTRTQPRPGTQPRLGFNPPRLRLNSDWDSTSTLSSSTPRIWCKQCVSGGGVHQKNGLLKRELLWVESQLELSPGSWDSTPTETQPLRLRTELRMGTQPRHFPLNPSNIVYNNVSRRCT